MCALREISTYSVREMNAETDADEQLQVHIYIRNEMLLLRRCFHTSLPRLSRKEINHDILKLVPLKARASVIDGAGKKTDNVPLKKFLQRNLDTKKEKLTIVNYRQSQDPGQFDPQIICKVVQLTEADRQAAADFSRQRYQEQKAAKKSSSSSSVPPKEKNVPISWGIGQADLNGQKKNAIESVLTRGHKAILELGRGGKRTRNISDLDLQKREWLVEKVKTICEELGAEEYKKSTGNLQSILTLYFSKR